MGVSEGMRGGREGWEEERWEKRKEWSKDH